MKRRKTQSCRSLHADVRHDGDCSIYSYGLDICDCGALRKAIRAGRRNGDETMLIAWITHIAALEKR